ncbi:hypothetical protein HMI56_007098 [Coelomomyces lativittatus]|nr:hypothetical protein HMI56_007098 [Coelomomyces lativittatus]
MKKTQAFLLSYLSFASFLSQPKLFLPTFSLLYFCKYSMNLSKHPFLKDFKIDEKTKEKNEEKDPNHAESHLLVSSPFLIKDALDDIKKITNTQFRYLSDLGVEQKHSSDWPTLVSEIESWLEKSTAELKIMESFQKETLAKDITSLRQALGDLIRTASLAMPE